MGRELAENVRIPSYGGRGSKIAQKNRHIIFVLNVPQKLQHTPPSKFSVVKISLFVKNVDNLLNLASGVANNEGGRQGVKG